MSSPEQRTAYLLVKGLGPFEAFADGRPVRFSYEKLKALLAFLLIESGQSHRRESVAERLWPDRPVEDARQNLRRAMFNLRRLLGERDWAGRPLFLSDKNSLAVNPDCDFWFDARELMEQPSVCVHRCTGPHCRKRVASLEGLARLYRGGFLEQVAIRDAPDFEEWSSGRREYFRRTAAAVCNELSACLIRNGDYPKALEYAERYLDLEPWSERGHRTLMQVFVGLGDRNAALRQFGLCTSVLERELGEKPEAETVALYERIRAGDLSGTSVHSPYCIVPETTRERRQVTAISVTFEVALRDDAEEQVDDLQGLRRELMDRVEARGGHLVNADGVGFSAYFGYPRACEASAARALDTALELTRSTSTPLRVGLHTGIIITGAEGGAPEAIGTVPRIAERLTDHCLTSEVLITEATRKLLRRGFHFTLAGEKPLGGWSRPTRFYRVETAETGSTPDAPFVGRLEALEHLRSAWTEAAAGRGGLVWIAGEAGMGKSRLLQEFRNRIEAPHLPHSYYCRDGLESTPFYPIAGSLRRLAGIRSDDPAEHRRHKLERFLSSLEAEERAALAALGARLGLDGTPVTDADDVPSVHRPLVEALRLQAARKPVLLVYEDMQWADPSTLAQLRLMQPLLHELPVLAVCTSRNTVPWTGASPDLELGPLPQPEIEAIISSIARDCLSESNLERLTETADGIPLFAEELARAAVEQQAEGDARAVPATLNDLLQVRLERLGGAKPLAQLAAALGRQFRLPLLRAAYNQEGATFDRALEALVHANILEPPRGTSDVYRFRHELIRQAAYRSQLKKDRSRTHSRIADLFTDGFPQLAEMHPERVADHLTLAGREAQAAVWWERAGEHAMTRGASVEATRHLEQARRCRGATAPDRPEATDGPSL